MAERSSEAAIREALAKGTFKLKNATHGKCPCGGEIRIGEVDIDGATWALDSVPVVMHATPLCKDFIDREPLDYLSWANAAKRAELN